MTTRAELKAVIARELHDPDGHTFTDAMLNDFIDQGRARIGSIAPERFQEDITPIADVLDYVLRSSVFDAPQPEIELSRVEVWDGTTTPNKLVARLQPGSEIVNISAGGWTIWNGILTVDNWTELWLDPDKHLIRVWGYSPYARLTDDADNVGLSDALEQALLDYCHVEGLKLLTSSRELFAQFQVRSNNTDISFAGLLSALNVASEAWRRKERSLLVLRERP